MNHQSASMFCCKQPGCSTKVPRHTSGFGVLANGSKYISGWPADRAQADMWTAPSQTIVEAAEWGRKALHIAEEEAKALKRLHSVNPVLLSKITLRTSSHFSGWLGGTL